MKFPAITTKVKHGNEKLIFSGKSIGKTLLDFWKWSVSDVVSNATRGRLAEFIVATALNVDLSIVRDEWKSYDLDSPEGIKIEIKSASYLQSWAQNDFSKINFTIKPTLHWDAQTNKQGNEYIRESDVYVFCLLKHKEQHSIDPLNLDQWEFYVLSTKKDINNYKRSKYSITLKSLKNLTYAIDYSKLYNEVIRKYNESV
jgi:hypothetical protein